jgi:predicted Zn-dependent peptidase
MVVMATQTKQEIIQTKLPNGLRVITAPMPWLRSVSVAVFVGAGSRYEEPHTNGVSHFLEHLFFGGTKKRPTSREISEAIESVGGYFNAYTGEDRTCFYAKVPAAHTERAFDVLADMLTESVFDPAKIDRERGVVTEEINIYNDDPSKQVRELFSPLMWPDQPLGMTVLGPKEVIASLDRETITQYVRERYQAGNMVLTVTGAIEPREVELLADRYFGNLASERTPSEALPAHEVPGPRVQLKVREADQAHFMIGAYAPSLTDDRRFAAKLLSAVLGEGMSSRLFLNVRERQGLAYSVYSYHDPLVDTGSISVKAGVTIEKAEEAVGAVIEEFDRLASELTPESEFTKAKEQTKGALELRLEDPGSLNDWLGSQSLLLDEVWEVSRVLSAYEVVTAEAVRELAAEIFRPENRHLVMVSPGQEEKRLRKVFT